MYVDRIVIALLWEIEVSGANGRVRFLTSFCTWKSYYFELTCMSQKAIVYVDCEN